MAYSYGYFDGSLVPLPIYAPQQAPYSTDNTDNTFEEWPVTTSSIADPSVGDGPYHRYTSDVVYMNAPSQPQWHPSPHLTLPNLVPQFAVPPLDQWQGSTSSTVLHMAPEMEPGLFYPLRALEPLSASSSLPLRGRARATMVYKNYDTSCDWEDPQDSLSQGPQRHGKNAPPIASRARVDPQRSPLPRTPRTMASRTKRTTPGSPAPSVASHQPAHQSNNPNKADYLQASEGRHFACEKGCPARFARKRDRDRHERSVHTGQTPYRCIGCQAGFVRSDARGRHWKAEPECHKKHLLAELPEGPSPGSE